MIVLKLNFDFDFFKTSQHGLDCLLQHSYHWD
jgi:hypothetical protein